MKVIERTDTTLVLEDQPWLLGAFVILAVVLFLAGGMVMVASGLLLGGLGMAVLGAGVPLLIGALMVRRVRLTLDLGTGLVTRASRSVAGLTLAQYALDRVVGAQVAQSRSRDSTTSRLELVLQGPPETVPFTSYYISGNRPEALCRTVNHWLRGTEPAAPPPAHS
jgi:hypothetical protein